MPATSPSERPFDKIRVNATATCEEVSSTSAMAADGGAEADALRLFVEDRDDVAVGKLLRLLLALLRWTCVMTVELLKLCEADCDSSDDSSAEREADVAAEGVTLASGEGLAGREAEGACGAVGGGVGEVLVLAELLAEMGPLRDAVLLRRVEGEAEGLPEVVGDGLCEGEAEGERVAFAALRVGATGVAVPKSDTV